jgi:hypothetical protein
MMIWHKKKFVKELVMADLDVRVRNIASEVTAAKLEEKYAEEKEQHRNFIRRAVPPYAGDKTRSVKPFANTFNTDPDEIQINITPDLPGSSDNVIDVDDHKNQYDKHGSPYWF